MTLFTSKLFLTYVYTVQPVKAMAHGAWLIKKTKPQSSMVRVLFKKSK